MTTKTYPQLGAASDVVGTDLLASWRSVGPLKKVTAGALRAYIWTDIPAANVNVINSGTGAVSRPVQTWTRDYVSVKDYGATGDGSTDDSTAVLAAFTASGGRRVLFPGGGTYVIGNVPLTGISNIEAIGYGATIKGPATRVTSYFNMAGSDLMVFKGFTFDQMKDDLPTYTAMDYPSIFNCPIYANANAGSVRCEDCKFTDLYTSAIAWRASGELAVDHCKFYSGTQAQNQWMQHINCQTLAAAVNISGCLFDNAAFTDPQYGPCGIFASGTTAPFNVDACLFNYCGRDNTGSHRLGVIDFYGDSVDVNITRCKSKNGMAQFMRLGSTARVHLQSLDVEINANAESTTIISIESTVVFFGVSGAQVGTQDVWIEDLTVRDPANVSAAGVAIVAYDWGTPSTDVRVLNSNFHGVLKPVVVEGPFKTVRVTGNFADGNRSEIIVQPHAGMTSTAGSEADSSFYDLKINGNTLINEADDDGGAISIGLSAATTALVDAIDVDENICIATSPNAGQGIVIQLNSSDKTKTIARCGRNKVKGYDYSYFIRENGQIQLEDNSGLDWVTGPLLYTPGDALNLITSGNRWTVGGVLIGTATLIGGTKTVTAPEARTGDRIMLSRAGIGGTLGFTSVGTITNGTSFVINSSAGADTSTINWEIVH